MSGILIIIGRVLGLGAVLFLGMFAFDSFSGDAPWWHHLVGFVVHLAPSLALLAIFLVSWRWPMIGGTLYLLAAIVPFLALSNPIIVNTMLAAPPALAGSFLIAGSLIAARG